MSVYSRKYDESAIPENYAGSAFERTETDSHPREEDVISESPPQKEEKTATKTEPRDEDILIPMIALWLFDRNEGHDLSPLLLLLLLFEF